MRMGKTKKRPPPPKNNVEPRKKAKVSQSNPPSSRKIDYKGVTNLTDEEKKRWANLTQPKRKVQCTKFIDLNALKELGMEDVMRKLFRKVGMEDFLTKKASTYDRYTYEFLTTLKKERGNPPHISFYLNNNRQRVSYDDIRKAFGWETPREGSAWEPLKFYDYSQFWRGITGCPLNPNGDKSSALTHPCLRLAHRFLTTTVSCNGEATKISRLEMSYLWAMTPEGVGVPDWAAVFVDNCLEEQGSTGGQLSMGGMVTLLAEYLGIQPPPELKPIDPSHMLYDVSTMKKLGLLAKSEGDYIWCHGPSGSPYLRLPRPPDALLPYGPLAKDFFLPADLDIAPYLGSVVERQPVLPGGVEVDEEEESEEGTVDSSSDWSVWRASVDDRLEELRDMQLETLAYMRSMSKMLSARYPNEYTPPDDALMTDLATRALARATRRDDHLTPGTSGPGESSHS